MVKELFKMLFFILLMPFMCLFVLVGYRTCWQCHNSFHRFQMKSYDLELFKGSKELVCKSCYELLTESR